MAAEKKNGMQCSEFDALLSEALDQRLSGDKLERFQAHARGCATCGPLLAEADAGLRWLHELVEVEPPVTLVDNILAATSGIDTVRLHGTARVQAQSSWFDRMQDWANMLVNPILGVAKQPRFAWPSSPSPFP
jgi:Putative zinc-finger